MSTIDVSVIIVSWNTEDVLRNCLKSIYEEGGDIAREVIVIDNASTDGSVEMVRKQFPQVVLIENSENRGFAAANNQGIKIAKGDKRKFGPVFITYILTAIVSYAVTFLIGMFTTSAYVSYAGSIIALLLGALIVSKRHDTSFGGGLIALIVPGIILAIIIVMSL